MSQQGNPTKSREVNGLIKRSRRWRCKRKERNPVLDVQLRKMNIVV
jgi:hypothetical protein